LPVSEYPGIAVEGSHRAWGRGVSESLLVTRGDVQKRSVLAHRKRLSNAPVLL